MKSRYATAIAGAVLVCATLVAAAQEIRRLDVEVVLGHRKKFVPHPEVFSPLNDARYQGGFRESFTSEIPEELKQVDALTRARKLGRLVVCADAWYYPFSITARKSDPPGIDLELVRAIAARHDWRVEIVWANTGPGAGLDSAFRKTIDHGYCDFFTGVVITGEDDDVERHKLVFTHPYVGLGFVLAVQGSAAKLTSLEEIKRQHVKIGVLMFSPMEHYIRMNDMEHELYYQNQRLIDGMVRHEVDAAVIWSGAMAVLKRDYDVDFEMVAGYVPPRDQRWNGAWVVPRKEKELREFLDRELDAMVASGEVRRIVESYGVPYYPPFKD